MNDNAVRMAQVIDRLAKATGLDWSSCAGVRQVIERRLADGKHVNAVVRYMLTTLGRQPR